MLYKALLMLDLNMPLVVKFWDNLTSEENRRK